jgi:hypothetical protein
MGHNHINVRTNQLSRQLAKVLVLSLRPSVFDHDIRALDVAEVTQAQSESLELSCVTGRRRGPEEANPRNLSQLLRARCERPRSCCAAKCEYEFSPSDVDCHATLEPEVVCMQ